MKQTLAASELHDDQIARIAVPRSATRRRIRGTMRRREAWAAWILLLPAIVLLLVWLIGPIFYSAYLSVLNWSGFGSLHTFAGMANYKSVLSDPLWLQSFRASGLYLVFYVPLVVVGSLVLALLVRSKLPEARLFRTVFFLPIAVPTVIAALVWQFIFDPSFGFVNYILGVVGVPKQGWLSSTTEALPVVAFVAAWTQLGYFMVIYMAALADVPKEYLEAASLDGASAWKRFRHIVIPLIKPTLLFVTVISVIAGLQDFDQVYILTQGGPAHATYLQVFYIYDQAFKNLNIGPASSASVLLFAVILALSLGQLKMFRGGRYE